MKKDLEILGLSEGAKWIEIQEAFDKLSNEYDPKNNDDLDFFIEEFEKIKIAYENLKNNYKEEVQSQIEKKSSNKNKSNSDLDLSKKNPNNSITKYKKCKKGHFYDENHANCPICELQLTESTSLVSDFTEESNNNETQDNNNDNQDSHNESSSNSDEVDGNEYSKDKSKTPKKNNKYLIVILIFIISALGGLIFYNSYQSERAKDYYYLAKQLFEYESYDRALEEINTSLSYDDNFPLSYKLKGEILINNEDYFNAIYNYQEALKKNIYFDSINYKMGYVKIMNQDYDEGLNYLKKFISKNLLNVSEKVVDMSVSENDSKFMNYFNLALCNTAIENKYVEDVIQDALFNRGLIYIYLDMYAEALKDYDRYILLNDSEGAAYNNRGVSYRRLGKPNNAMEDYTKAIELNSEKSLYYRNRGNLYYSRNDYIKAYNDYSKSIELGYNISDLNSDYYNKSKEEYEKDRRQRYTSSKKARYNKLKIGQYYKGGVIFDLTSNYKVKILALTTTSRKVNQSTAFTICTDLVLNGFSDWRMPTASEVYKISSNFYKVNNGLSSSGLFNRKIKLGEYYWSSDYKDGYYKSVKIDPGNYYIYNDYRSAKRYVRAVREFNFR